MEFDDAKLLLEPGYLPFESGYQDLSGHKKLVAALTRMPGCRAKMVDWWFSWLDGIEHYRLWHPRDHVASAWLNRTHDGYIGASHVVSEYLAGPTGPVHDLQIDFHDPFEIFDAERYRASGSVAICARIGEQRIPVHTGRMCHFVRDTDYGCEMRSRFWLGVLADRKTGEPVPEHVAIEMRKSKIDPDFVRRLHQHATEEMGYLAEILPVLYRRVTNDNSF